MMMMMMMVIIIIIIIITIQGDTQKRELLKNPTKIEEIQEKKFIDRNFSFVVPCIIQ